MDACDVPQEGRLANRSIAGRVALGMPHQAAERVVAYASSVCGSPNQPLGSVKGAGSTPPAILRSEACQVRRGERNARTKILGN